MVSKARLATMDAAEENRTLKEATQGDGERERATVRGVKVSDNSTKPADLVGKRERAPSKGVRVSDIPTQLLGSTRVVVTRTP